MLNGCSRQPVIYQSPEKDYTYVAPRYALLENIETAVPDINFNRSIVEIVHNHHHHHLCIYACHEIVSRFSTYSYINW